MTLKLYFDLLSQPSRGLYMFFKKTKVPFEPVLVALRKGEHLTDDFKQINRFQKVPAIEHNGFQLAENIAIMRYVTREFKIDDHWYPKDSQKQAKVDEYLEWQHNNTRFHCAIYFQVKWLKPLLAGEPPKPNNLYRFEVRLKDCLDQMENMWLANSPYLAGDTISFADILGTCEIEQTKMADYDPCDGRPKMKAWMERVRNEMNPFYDEAHKIVYSVIERNKTNAPWMAKL